MTLPRMTATAASVVLLATGLLAATHSNAAASSPDTHKITRLLSEVKTQAVILSTDADMMESYTLSSVSWEGHSDEINQIRDHINKAGREVAQLDEMRKMAAPWQQAAIDRIRPDLQELADNTTKAIRFLNKNPDRLFEPQYKDYLEANADVSSQLATMIGNYVSYGRAKNRMEMLAGKLELPAKD